MKYLKILLAFMLLSLSACITTSIYPLYESRDLVTRNDVIGDWYSSKTLWTIKKKYASTYEVVYKECSDPLNRPTEYTSCTIADFEMHLLEIDGQLYADFVPTNYSRTENQFLLYHLRPLHSFAKINIMDNELNLIFLESEAVKDLVKENPSIIDYIEIDGGIVLTAPTKELKGFIKKINSDPDMFAQAVRLKKKHTN